MLHVHFVKYQNPLYQQKTLLNKYLMKLLVFGYFDDFTMEGFRGTIGRKEKFRNTKHHS